MNLLTDTSSQRVDDLEESAERIRDRVRSAGEDTLQKIEDKFPSVARKREQEPGNEVCLNKGLFFFLISQYYALKLMGYVVRWLARPERNSSHREHG